MLPLPHSTSEVEQERIAQAVVEADDTVWLLDGAPEATVERPAEQATRQHHSPTADNTTLPRRPLRCVGGVDISFVKGSDQDACASLVVLEFPSLRVVYEAFERVTMAYPYVPGFLAFREVSCRCDGSCLTPPEETAYWRRAVPLHALTLVQKCLVMRGSAGGAVARTVAVQRPPLAGTIRR